MPDNQNDFRITKSTINGTLYIVESSEGNNVKETAMEKVKRLIMNDKDQYKTIFPN